MNFSKIEKESELNDLIAMAHEIWSSYFGSMFDNKTLLKLIEGAQSKQVILKQIADGYKYFFIHQDKERIGYLAYKIDRIQRELFLSKIYLYEKHRGRGLGKRVLRYLEDLCAKQKIDKLVLTVYYKNISSIKAYEKWGFSNLGLIKRNFDNGLIFDDIKMEKNV